MLGFAQGLCLPGTSWSTGVTLSKCELASHLSQKVIACQNGLLVQREKVVPLLRRDLLIQLDAPNSMNWDLYDSSITFDDPMTQLSGRLPYRVCPQSYTNDINEEILYQLFK